MENPIKMDDLGVSLFLETPTYETWFWSIWKPSWVNLFLSDLSGMRASKSADEMY